jgi:hypothetical protein
MRVGKFLLCAGASLFLHAAALPLAVKLFNRNRAPIATQVLKERIHPVELISLGPEPKPPIVMPQITPVQISIPEVNLPEIPKMPEPAGPPLEKPQIVPRRRSGSRSAEAVPLPSPPEPAEAPPAVSNPTSEPQPLSEPETIQHTVMVIVNGQRFPIHVEAPAEESPVTMPVPGGLATEPASQEVIREVAMESMDRAELTPAPATPAPQQPEASEDQREQLLSEGCWVVQNGTGTIRCPSWHPSNQPSLVYEQTGDGFIVGMHDPSVIGGNLPERRYHFQRQADGSYIYRDSDGRNSVIIHSDGRVEYQTSRIAVDGTSGSFVPPWEDPNLPLYIYSEIDKSTAPVVRQITEQHDNSVMSEALDGLFQDLSDTIARHPEWSPSEQREYLFGRWNECERTERGQEARRIIEKYIRENYPDMSLPEAQQ